jgi:Rrf2 family transcriptional regulator, nitric oxide-sensitive transcriptional repressor
MQLTKQTDFAFRILIYLARMKEGEITQIQQVCDFYDISANHIAKVVVKLVRLGYITAYRGKGGGITLAKVPQAINLAEIVKAFETSLQPVNCEQPECRIVANCKLRGILYQAMQQFVEVLGSYTVADLVADPSLAQVVQVK